MLAHGRVALASVLLALMVVSVLPAVAIPGQQSLGALAATGGTAKIPDINSAAPPSDALNIGPAFPSVVMSGSSENVTVILREPLNGNVTKVCAYRVYLDNGSLVEGKEALGFYQVDNRTIVIVAPGSALEPGLYDIIIKAESNTTRFVPRGLWIITPETVAEYFTFQHITDAHFGAGSPNITIGQDRRFVGYLMSQLLGVDAIMNTGDEADTASANQYRNSLAFRYAFAYTVPMFMAPGNHDYPNANFMKYYGDTVRYAIIGGKILVVSINTDGEVGHADSVNLTFLENVLEEHKDTPIKIVLMHHPVFYYQGKLYLTYNSTSPLLDNPRQNRNSALSYYWGPDQNMTRWLLRLVEQYNVTMVLAGHIHRDQYVEYHSTWTGSVTYFQTTTTLAHGTGTYQGFQVTRLNLTSGVPSYPYAPEWFTGYENHSRSDVYNSLPLTTPNYAGKWKDEFGDKYLFGWYSQGETGIVFSLINKLPYLSINRTVIISLPWPANYSAGLQVLDAENASVEIVSTLYSATLSRMFIALHFNMTPISMVKFVLYSAEDVDSPQVTLKRTIPRKPAINKPIKAYITVTDQGWGVDKVTANATTDRGDLEYFRFYKYGDTTYIAEFKVSSNYSANVTITVEAIDYAGHTTVENLTISLAGPTPPAETTTTTTTTTTSPAETATTTTETTTTQTTETTTTTQTTGQQTTTEQPTQQPTETTETPAQEKGGNTAALIVIVVVIIVIAGALFFLKK